MWAYSDVRCRFLEHFFLALSCFGSEGGGLASTGRSVSASVPELSSSRHAAWPNFADFRSSGDLGCVQTDATLLTNNSQHCWMLHVASVCTLCCMLLDVVACCCAQFETGQTFQPTTPNISFVPWSPKRSATMLDPFAQFFQHCWGHARLLRMVYRLMGFILPMMHCRSQYCWELLRPFAHSLTNQMKTLQ